MQLCVSSNIDLANCQWALLFLTEFVVCVCVCGEGLGYIVRLMF